MYRLADSSSSKSRAVTPVTSESRRQHSASPRTPTADVNANGNVNGSVNANRNANRNVIEDVLLAEPMDTSMWPWAAPWNWNDLQLGESKHDSSRWTSNLHTMDHPQNDTGTAFLDSFQSVTDWAPTANGDSHGSARGGLLSLPHRYDHGPSFGTDLFECNGSIMTPTINTTGPDAGIAQLSQLSTRLYPLHRSSCALAESGGSLDQSNGGNPARQSPLIDDDAFKSVAMWLVHASSNMDWVLSNPALETTPTGNTLHDAFSASHHLLEILRGLPVDVMPTTTSSTSSLSTSNTTATGEAPLDFWAHNTPQSMLSTQDQTTSYFDQRYARPSSQYSHTVVRHLVIACHTLLLNIYVALLVALQREADRNLRLAASNADAGDARMDAAAMTDIRLVTVVQLCSFLVQRQYQAVDSYLAPQTPSLSSGSSPPSPPLSTAASREVMSELEAEVQLRLARLRQTLRI